MGSLGGRKPSDLLYKMMEVCPTVCETSTFFAFLFLQHLPKELRIMLGEDDVDDLLAISLNADKLWSIHNHQQHGVVASLSSTSGCYCGSCEAVISGEAAWRRLWQGSHSQWCRPLFLSQPFGGRLQPALILSSEVVCWPLLLPLVFGKAAKCDGVCSLLGWKEIHSHLFW
jgi:hypothetical protein